MSALASALPRLGFGVGRTNLKHRADVNYARLAPSVADFFARSTHPLVRLGDFLSIAQYGTSSRALEEEVGPPMLRMVNLQDGDWDMSNLKYTTLELGERTRFVLQKRDILFNRTNSKELVGKCGVFREDGDWVFASYLIRIRLKDSSGLLAEFVARFLNSDVGRKQIDQLSRQIIGMSNINREEIRELRVPRPPEYLQRTMVADLDEQWQAHRAALRRFRHLLAAGDTKLATELGIALPRLDRSNPYATTRRNIRGDDRMNAEFFHPERALAVRAIMDAAVPAQPLDAVAARVIEHVAAPGADDFYVGLANIERDTGEFVATADEEHPTGAVIRFKRGDVLFSKLRPYLNKVHLAERGGVCSPEFIVLRPRHGVRAEYLASILRSQIVLNQTRHMAGGNTHPRLLATDVKALLIPLPKDAIQHRYADEAAAKRCEAQRVKQTAERAWVAAKSRFGDELLQ